MKSFETLLSSFERELRFRNYSASSIRTYKTAIVLLHKSFNKPVEEITCSELKRFLYEKVNTDGLSTSFINQQISAYKILQVDILERDWDPIRLKRPRKNLMFPNILSLEEINLILDAISNIKHRAMVSLMYSAGLRRSEVLAIKPQNIDSSRMRVKVENGKGGKDRYTILSTKTLETLRLHYRYNRPKVYLFEPNGKPGQKLSAATIRSVVKNAVKKAHISKEVSCHTFRHCFATHLLENNINLKVIQQMMGHSSLKTTSRYLQVANVTPENINSPFDTFNV